MCSNVTSSTLPLLVSRLKELLVAEYHSSEAFIRSLSEHLHTVDATVLMARMPFWRSTVDERYRNEIVFWTEHLYAAALSTSASHMYALYKLCTIPRDRHLRRVCYDLVTSTRYGGRRRDQDHLGQDTTVFY